MSAEAREPSQLLARALERLDAARGSLGTALYLEDEGADGRRRELTAEALKATEAAADLIVSASLGSGRRGPPLVP